MAAYPKDPTSLPIGILAQQGRQSAHAIINLVWKGDTLLIQAHPERNTKPVDYETLLQTSLALIQAANNNQMPIINGRALRRALEQPSGMPIEIFKRKKPAKAVNLK